MTWTVDSKGHLYFSNEDYQMIMKAGRKGKMMSSKGFFSKKKRILRKKLKQIVHLALRSAIDEFQENM